MCIVCGVWSVFAPSSRHYSSSCLACSRPLERRQYVSKAPVRWSHKPSHLPPISRSPYRPPACARPSALSGMAELDTSWRCWARRFCADNELDARGRRLSTPLHPQCQCGLSRRPDGMLRNLESKVIGHAAPWRRLTLGSRFHRKCPSVPASVVQNIHSKLLCLMGTSSNGNNMPCWSYQMHSNSPGPTVEVPVDPFHFGNKWPGRALGPAPEFWESCDIHFDDVMH